MGNLYGLITLLFAYAILFSVFSNTNVIAQTEMTNQTTNHYREVAHSAWQNWLITPEDNPILEEGNCYAPMVNQTYMLYNPYKIELINQTCEIESFKEIYFPFINGLCTSGNIGNYGDSFLPLFMCALDSDKGIFEMKAWWDGKKIIDITIDHTNLNNSKIIRDLVPENKDFFREIKSVDSFDINMTSDSPYVIDFQNPEEFMSAPKTYDGALHAFAGIIPAELVTPGNHTLSYNTIVKNSAGGLDATGGSNEGDWKINYTFKVK